MVGHIAVSYTHLDVYKRQLLISPILITIKYNHITRINN